jgi:Kdo2-lipid IVA lauroyltransferase/acyltransferase
MIFFKSMGLVLGLIPRPLFLVLGRTLGKILLALGFRSEVARENIALALPELRPEEREFLLKGSFGELGILFLELLRFFYRFPSFVERNTVLENQHYLKDALAQGKGVLVSTAHLGNWEVLAAAGPVLVGVSSTMVTKSLKPQWLQRIVVVVRELMGVKMAFEPKTLSQVMRALRNKEIVGFVMDQYAGAPVGARVPFFGKPVGSHTALATIALRTGAPIVPGVAVRDVKGRYHVKFYPPIPLPEAASFEEKVLKLTAALVAQVESMVREYPEQWLWIHRRWKGDLSPLPQGAIGEMLL